MLFGKKQSQGKPIFDGQGSNREGRASHQTIDNMT